MSVTKKLFWLFLLFSNAQVLAQVEQVWVRRYNGTWAYGLEVDKNGNVYVTGSSGTLKYSTDGDSLFFVRRYGYGSDDISVDDSENLYITSGAGTIKYSPTGDSLRFGLFGLYLGEALELDWAGNVYVTGTISRETTYADYITIKYNPLGDTLWTRYYQGSGYYSVDLATALKLDENGDIFVTGYSFDTATSEDYATIKYSADGGVLWVRRYNGEANDSDIPGHPYGPSQPLAVDRDGNVFVTGRSIGIGTFFDYATIKYSPTGDSLWVRRYNGPADSNDFANAIAVDDSGNVYVTGISRNIGLASDDIATIKYSPNGDELWVRRYDGPNGWDGANALAIDSAGNVYVSGYSRSGTHEDYITIKYSPDGDILWQMRYDGPTHYNDVGYAMVIDDKANVYVTGRSFGGNETFDDYATIKYVQYICLAKPGDANGDGLVSFSDITTIINVLFKGQPAPGLFCGRDTNEDGTVLLSDVVYLINFLFKSGPAPSKNKECCL